MRLGDRESLGNGQWNFVHISEVLLYFKQKKGAK